MNECTIDSNGNAFYNHSISIPQVIGPFTCDNSNCECNKKIWIQYPPYKRSE